MSWGFGITVRLMVGMLTMKLIILKEVIFLFLSLTLLAM